MSRPADVSDEVVDTGVAPATINRLRQHGRFEVDGILALTSWLGQPLETFTRIRQRRLDLLDFAGFGLELSRRC